MSGFMNTNDAPSSKLATLYCTVGGRRYAMLNAKNFEAKANVSLADVPILCISVRRLLIDLWKNTRIQECFQLLKPRLNQMIRQHQWEHQGKLIISV